MRETLGYKIKVERLKNRLSKKEVSQRMKISRSYITELEEDKYTNPSMRVLCGLCKTFGCSPNDLIPEELYK